MNDRARPPELLPAATRASHVTLALMTLLHAFTHAFGTLLVPLYLIMHEDLGTRGVKYISAIVTVYGFVYCALSYPGGILADRFSRKVLLGVGLVGNGLAIALMGMTANYWGLVALAVMGGIFGTLFHPSANALAAGHYPRNPGLAIGLMGIGSGLGFFAGPQFAGWRAQTVTPAGLWWDGMRSWQVPLLEAGVVGVIVGVVFLALAREVAHEAKGRGKPMGPGMRRRVLSIAAVLGCRDFAGIATTTLVSLYLMKAHGYNARQAGLVVGAMMLISMVANPIAVTVSNGPRRLPMMSFLLIVGGVILVTVPYLPVRWVLAVLAVFQVFHLGSYAVGETALLERVDPAVRGRVIGLFIGSAGTAASLSPWIIGAWVDRLGQRAASPAGYVLPFGVLGAMMVFAAFSVKLIAKLGLRQRGSEPALVTGMAPSIEPIA